jgi:hypothetical protein
MTEWTIRNRVGAPRLILLYEGQIYDLDVTDPKVPRPVSDVAIALMQYAIEKLRSKHDQ